MADWPVYHNMSELETGGWRCTVQNSNGEIWEGDYKDPIMAETAAAKNADRLGVELPLSVFWLNLSKVSG